MMPDSATPTSPKRVFISYTHDGDEHKAKVLKLADSLRKHGVHCELDQYHIALESGDGAGWMRKQIRDADCVLLICTEQYLLAWNDELPADKRKGARWEIVHVRNAIYAAGSKNDKFIPVLLRGNDSEHIPDTLGTASYYVVADQAGFDTLYWRITQQHDCVAPEVGDVVKRPRRGGRDTFDPPGLTEKHAAAVRFRVKMDAAIDARDMHSVSQVFEKLRSICPDAELRFISARNGSLVLEVEGPLEALELVKQSHKQGTLSQCLGCTVISIEPSPTRESESAVPRNLPERNPRFVGREAELDELHRRLNREVEIGVTQQAAAFAHGGVGKTSIAHEYAWRHLADYPGGAFVLSCDTDQLLPAVVELAGPLGLSSEEKPEEIARRVKDRLADGPPSLLILDNVRDAEQWSDQAWRAWLPGGHCRRLITTRARNLPGVEMYPIERLPREQGIRLLAKYRADASDAANAQIVGDIVDWFDGLAVGLAVVGAYMAMNPELGWAAYAKSLEAKGLGAVRETENLVGKLPDYEQRVDAVFEDALAALPLAQRRAMEYAAILPEDTVVRSWLTWLLEHDTTIELPAAPGYEDRPSAAVVAALVTRGLLVPFRGGEGMLAVHRVLRRYLGEQLNKEPEHRAALLDAVVALAEERGEASWEAVLHPELRSELTPLVALVGPLEAAGRFDTAVKLANRLGEPLIDLGRYAEGRYLLEPMAARCEAEPNAVELSEQAVLFNNLSLPLWYLGELCEARRLMERAIEIEKKQFEPDWPILAIRYSNLAAILTNLGELREARQLMERGIKIGEQFFEPDHPNLAICYSNLATILENLGELPQARRLIERAIQIDERHLEPDHPALATSYSNLTAILTNLGELPEARRLMKRAIEIEEKHFDPDHPTLATSYSNLALILQDLGELREARLLMEQTIEIKEKHFDPDHPTLATSYSNLAMILQDLGDLSEARRLSERAIQIEEKHFEPDHPSLATTYHNLAGIESADGKQDEALALEEKALAILLKHFGENHPHVKISRKFLAYYRAALEKVTPPAPPQPRRLR